jgi:hypothetical protein
MRPLELALSLILAAALAAEMLPPRLRATWWSRLQLALAVTAAVIFQLHALLEGPRRELLPLYALGLAVLAWTAARTWTRRPSDAEAAAGTSYALDLLLALGGLALLGWTWWAASAG